VSAPKISDPSHQITFTTKKSPDFIGLFALATHGIAKAISELAD
jgi:hypothetical protein